MCVHIWESIWLLTCTHFILSSLRNEHHRYLYYQGLEVNLLLLVLLFVLISGGRWRRCNCVEPVDVGTITGKMYCVPHLHLITSYYTITANVPCDLVRITHSNHYRCNSWKFKEQLFAIGNKMLSNVNSTFCMMCFMLLVSVSFVGW